MMDTLPTVLTVKTQVYNANVRLATYHSLDQPLVIVSFDPFSALPKWRYQAGGRGITARRESGGVYGWWLGYSVC